MSSGLLGAFGGEVCTEEITAARTCHDHLEDGVHHNGAGFDAAVQEVAPAPAV